MADIHPGEASRCAPPALPQLWHGRAAFRLSALQAANFAGIGIYMPFMPPWLAAQGLTDRQIGLTLAMGMIIRMLVSQPVSTLGDGRWGAARVLVVIHLLGAVAYLALMALPTPGAVMAAMAVVAVLSAGVVPLGDHLTTAQVRLRPALDFARMRLWGSIAFLAFSIASGFAVARLGIGLVPAALCLCSLLAALVAAGAPDAGRDSRSGIAGLPAPVEDSPLRNRILWLAIIASALINASHAMLYGFATLHWRSLGIDDGAIGVLWASAVIAEIALFWWLGRRASSSLDAAIGFLALAGLAAILRFGLLPFASSGLAILGLQMLHAFSFGAQLLGVMAIVARLAPQARGAMIQGRLSAANACLMGTATLASGFAFEAFGAFAFLAMLPVAAAGLVALAFTWRLTRSLALDSADAGTLPVVSGRSPGPAPG